MSERSLLPTAEPTDAQDVRWALETAQSLWNQGERREALQWVRRAAEAAAESGADDRALLLAKMGAELRGVLDIPRTLPPPRPADAAPPAEQRPDRTERADREAEQRPDRTERADREEGELVVTVVSADGKIPAPDASLVSHRALRVAVTAGTGNGELVVRVLSAGQLAPENSKVALLVALEPGSSPLP
ncbi:MAG TPA: hypothetical protein VHC69_26950 [Polyangiaceae bacterium]|nr:hypothetical protein [Polyangiaceae bacterium]